YDHWYDDVRKERYYLQTAEMYVRDAETLLGVDADDLSKEERAARVQDVASVRTLLELPSLTVDGPSFKDWADRPQQEFGYHWQAPAAMLPGYALFVPKIDQSLSLTDKDALNRKRVELEPLKVDATKLGSDSRLEVKLGTVPRDESRVTMQTLYRGELIPVK